jgi:hypothetical protein
MARRNDMNKVDNSLTPSVVLPGELNDIEQFERDLRAMDEDLERMSYAEFSAWVASLEDEDREAVLVQMTDAEVEALENWEPETEEEAA